MNNAIILEIAPLPSRIEISRMPEDQLHPSASPYALFFLSASIGLRHSSNTEKKTAAQAQVSN